jgi:hypothetical protein
VPRKHLHGSLAHQQRIFSLARLDVREYDGMVRGRPRAQPPRRHFSNDGRALRCFGTHGGGKERLVVPVAFGFVFIDEDGSDGGVVGRGVGGSLDRGAWGQVRVLGSEIDW